jgi:hypothetical protein
MYNTLAAAATTTSVYMTMGSSADGNILSDQSLLTAASLLRCVLNSVPFYSRCVCVGVYMHACYAMQMLMAQEVVSHQRLQLLMA